MGGLALLQGRFRSTGIRNGNLIYGPLVEVYERSEQPKVGLESADDVSLEYRDKHGDHKRLTTVACFKVTPRSRCPTASYTAVAAPRASA